MRFEKKYPLALNDLLLAPVVFRSSLPQLARCPLASADGMRDLAEFGGYSPGAIRTAMSRLRAAGWVEGRPDAHGVTRYSGSAATLSIKNAVVTRPTRPTGFLLVVFSFTAEDVRQRQVVRDALKLYGFQKLAQNVYINGQIETAGLEAEFERQGLTNHVFFFRSQDGQPGPLRARLTSLFDLPARARALHQFHRDLTAFLEDSTLDEMTFARRFFYAGPVHYRITFTEEPPLPAETLPPDYPLDALLSLIPSLASSRANALVRYFKAVHI